MTDKITKTTTNSDHPTNENGCPILHRFTTDNPATTVSEARVVEDDGMFIVEYVLREDGRVCNAMMDANERFARLAAMGMIEHQNSIAQR